MKSIASWAALSGSGSCSEMRSPALATCTARSQTIWRVKRGTSFGSAAGGAVATAYALPSSPSAASRSAFGSALACLGSTSESGDSGTPSSPTAVLSSKRPATCASESSVAAVTVPVTFDTSA